MAGAGGLRVYYDLMSQPSRAVYMFLKATKIPYIDKPVALRKGEHLGDEYKKINPFHLVPVIDDNGFKLPESVAILSYLADKYRVPDHWYPKDLQARARVNSFLAWQHINLRLNAAMVFRTLVIDPRMSGAPVDKVKLAQFRKELDIVLDKMEGIYLRDNAAYLCGTDICIGDLLAICELMQDVACGVDVFQDRPVLHAWGERVKARLAPHFDEAHVMVYKLMAAYKAQPAKM